jgi:hypothetical protein
MKEKEEMEWKVDEAISAFKRYKQAIEDEKVKQAMIKELKKRSKEMKKLAEDLD